MAQPSIRIQRHSPTCRIISSRPSPHARHYPLPLSLSLVSRHATPIHHSHGVLVDVQAEPAVTERAGPGARPVAPRHRLPGPPRLHRHGPLLLVRLVGAHLLHRHRRQPHRRPRLALLRRRRRRPRLRPHPRLAPRAQPLRAPLRRGPRRAHPVLVPRLRWAPRRRLLLLAAHPDPGQAPRPGERPPLRAQLRRASHPRLRMLPVPDADGAAGDAGQPRRLGGCALLPGPLGPLSRDCPGSDALCTDCYCYTTVHLQPAVCSCVCHRIELCSDDVACLPSEVDSIESTRSWQQEQESTTKTELSYASDSSTGDVEVEGWRDLFKHERWLIVDNLILLARPPGVYGHRCKG